MIRRRAGVSRRGALAVVAVAIGATWLAGCARESAYRIVARHPAIDAASLRAIELKVEQAVKEGLYPGGVVSVRANELQLERAVGVADPANGRRVGRHTPFDIASLTKPISTATRAAILVEEGRLAWDEEVLPGVTVDEVLRHQAPMPANFDWRALEQVDRAGDNVSTLVLCENVLAATPAQELRVGYGNAGYFLLGAYFESPDLQLDFASMSNSPTLYSLTTYQTIVTINARWLAARTAPDVEPGTPFDPLAAWARAHGRPYGHSGLFADASLVGDWAAEAMAPTSTWGPALFHRDSPAATRSRAFEIVPRRDRSGVAFRHTGYTGCLLWLDPERQLSLVLLTNRGGNHTAAWDRHVEGLVNELERGWENRPADSP